MGFTISIALNPPYNGEYYSSNDTISGTVSIHITKALSIKRINVKLKGFIQTLTRMDNDRIFTQSGMMIPAQDNRSVHTLVDITQRVFPPDNVWDAIEGSSKPFKVKPGDYDYQFEFPKMREKPQCLETHSKRLPCFVTSPRKAKLPPSFNNKWQDLSRVDNLDLYFYSFGKVLYTVQVQLELGKPISWYKPFDKFIREIQVIEFIPQPKELFIEDDEEDSLVTTVGHNPADIGITPIAGNLVVNKNIPLAKRMAPIVPEYEESRMNSPNTYTSSSNDNNGNQNGNGLKIYNSTYPVQLPDDTSLIWLEVRSKGFKQTFRRDLLFYPGCNKFDSVFIMSLGKEASFRNLHLTPVKVQLNLLEKTTYLSQGVANQNFTSLRLIEVDDLAQASLLDMSSVKVKQPESKDQPALMELELKLKDHPILKKLRFNKEDYKHRGNRLYSFKSCTIKRLFAFQLLLDWEINGRIRQSEVIIDKAQIFCQTRERTKTELLPKYIDPPTYTQESK